MKLFIRLVPEEFSLVGNPAEQSMIHHLMLRAGLVRELPQRMVE
jgi:hypothetical protein